MRNSERIVYSINVNDLQDVAEAEFGRKLTAPEIRSVEGRLGDFINWYDAIEYAIGACIDKPVQQES